MTPPRSDGAWPWRKDPDPAIGSGSFAPPSSGATEALGPGFFRRSAETVARDLLGRLLVSTVGGSTTAGVVVETEAYVGPHDPASHARASVGRTERNASMFGVAGRAYVYLSYGIHWCLNVVTDEPGHPAAVLVRALDPAEGLETMADRRGRDTELTSGPGRLSEALGVTGALDGHVLSRSPLRLRAGWRPGPDRVGVSGRIGIRRAADWPLRFYLRNHPAVSRPPSN